MKAITETVKGKGQRARLIKNHHLSKPTALRRLGIKGRAGLCCLLIFAFCSLPLALAGNMQNVENKNAIAAAGFPKLVDEYIKDYYSRHPNIAAASGLHAWDGELEDYSSSAISDEISAIKKFQSRLEKIPPLELAFSDIF